MDIDSWAFGEQLRFAEVIAGGGALVPPFYRQDPVSVLIAMRIGRQYGLEPCEALYRVYVADKHLVVEGAARIPLPPAGAKPAPESAVQAAADTSAELEMITRNQVTKVAVVMNEVGICDRELALAVVAQIISRPVGSRNELTKAEASQVIDLIGANDERLQDVLSAAFDQLAQTGKK